MKQQEKPIYRLYESNIGLIVPMIKEMLDQAEKEYPYLWIERAVELAVRNNARSWHYVEVVLKRWAVEGFNGNVRKAKYMPKRRDTAEARRRYAEWEKR